MPYETHKRTTTQDMASIRSKNTKTEILVRKFLWRLGFRYKVNNPRLPGHPAIVLRKYRTCVFVNGCFWHGHMGCKYFRIPRTNTEFWETKISRNREQDKQEHKRLAAMGWHVIVIWECQLKPVQREQALTSLVYTLNHIYLQDHSITDSQIDEESEIEIAAESFE